MKRLLAVALIVPLMLSFGTTVGANDAHHPGKQAKSKAASTKKPAKKPSNQTPPQKKQPRG